MLATVIEVVGIVAALLGGVVYLRRAAGARRLLGLLPVALYVAAQVAAMGHEPERFRAIYPYALAGMALAGAIGIVLLLRAPPPRADGWQDEPPA